MIDILVGIGNESYILLNKMAIYLLFGYMFAGILHIFLQPETIARHLGKSSFGAVMKASLFGIPLPLCSCGVIPAALSLRKEGASKGAVLSFLISTPTTGIDSIFATFALLGGFFAAYRVCASFIAAFFVGILANIFLKPEQESPKSNENIECKVCNDKHDHHHTLKEKAKRIFTYAFGDLLHESGKWLLIGIVIGGGISYFLPEEVIHNYIGTGWMAIVIMFIIGIPMYVCASGSIPIAAALMLKGLNPGAAFAFLLSGPATNTVTMTIVYRNLGKGALILYLTAIAGCSLGLGLLLNMLWEILGMSSPSELIHHRILFPVWLERGAGVLLLLLIALNGIKWHKNS